MKTRDFSTTSAGTSTPGAMSRRAACCLGLLAVLGRLRAGESSEGGSSRRALRLGVSQASFGSAHRNEASAALKVWADSLIRERHLDIEIQVEAYDDLEVLLRLLREKTLDGASLLPAEFQRIEERPDTILVPATGKILGQSYSLVVRRAAGVRALADLAQRRLVIQTGPRTTIAQPWLETLLHDQGLPEIARFFQTSHFIDSPSKSILQVFFDQADVALVLAASFATAAELNPGLRQDLVEFVQSPPLTNGLFFLRPGVSPELRNLLEDAVTELHLTPAGKQVLMMLQGSRMVRAPLSALDTTFDLLRRYEALKSKTSPAAPAPMP